MKKSIITLLLVVLATTTPHAVDRDMWSDNVKITFTAQEYRHRGDDSFGLSRNVRMGMSGKELYDYLSSNSADYREAANLLKDSMEYMTRGRGGAAGLDVPSNFMEMCEVTEIDDRMGDSYAEHSKCFIIRVYLKSEYR